MVSLYRDPHGKKIFPKLSVEQHVGYTNKREVNKDRTIESLEVKVKELESALSKYVDPQIQNPEPASRKTSEVTVSFVQLEDENIEIVRNASTI
jgi:hypothetical protein